MNKKTQKEKRYRGYFLMDSGIKIFFDISEEEGGEEFWELYSNSNFLFEGGSCIWLGDERYILTDRIIGFSIDEYLAED